jgi:hypothetical protein
MVSMKWRRAGRARRTVAGIVGLAALPLVSFAAQEDAASAVPTGVWRGTSTCTDRLAAPACRDEVVVYEFTPGAKPGTVRWKADKIVDGQRQPMGELELAYDAPAACWMAEFSSPRVHSVWCLAVDGVRLTGTARVLPGSQIVRKLDARKD